MFALAVSLTVGGPIVDALGPRAAYSISGILTVIAALIMTSALRHPGLPPHQADLAFEFAPAEPVAVDRTATS